MKKRMYTIIIWSIDYYYDILEDWEEAYDYIGKTILEKPLWFVEYTLLA